MCSITRRLPLGDPVAGYSDPAWLTITAPGLIAAIPERLNLRLLIPAPTRASILLSCAKA
jgi:hypothetical protein